GAGSSLQANLSGVLSVTGSLSMDGRTVVSLPSGSITLDGSLQLLNVALSASASLSTVSLRVFSEGVSVGLGSGSVRVSSMNGSLSMSGNVDVSGVLSLSASAGGLSLDGRIAISNASVVGSLLLAGASIRVSSGGVVVDVGRGSLSLRVLEGSTSINGSVSLSGMSVISGSLSSSGASDINGVSRLSGVMNAYGLVLINGSSLINGLMSMGSGSVTLNSSGMFMFGDVAVLGNLGVSGLVSIAGNVSMEGTIIMTGASTISGRVSLSGRVNTNNIMFGEITLRADSMVTLGTTVINGRVEVMDGLLKITRVGTEIAGSVKITGSVSTTGSLTVKNPEISGNTVILSQIITVGKTTVRGLFQLLTGNLPPAGLLTSSMDTMGQIVMLQSLILGSTVVNGIMTVTENGVVITGLSDISGSLLALSTPSLGQNAIISISQAVAVTPVATVPLISVILPLTLPILLTLALVGLIVARLIIPPVAIASGRMASKAYRKALGPETRVRVAYVRVKSRLAPLGERMARRTASLLRKPLAKGYMLASQNRVSRRIALAIASIEERVSRRTRPFAERIQVARRLASRASSRMSAVARRAGSTARSAVAKVATIEIFLSGKVNLLKRGMAIRARAIRERARVRIPRRAAEKPVRRILSRVRIKRTK
ncbi:MAG: hypothetical protein QW461_01570, partial [Candidatus Jordarchaeales archaeon]